MLPSRSPFPIVGPSGFQCLATPDRLLSQVHPLLHFDATSASFPSGYCLPTGVNCRQQPPSKSTSLELLDPSAFTDLSTLFFTSDSEGVEETLPVPSKSRPQGLATLSTVSQPAQTLESLFQLSTLLGFALQSFPPLQ